jgi:DNA-binding NtrC family response regulator
MNTILIVDDEYRIRRAYRKIFERRACRVFDTDNIITARELMKVHGIDVVLLDINMGELSGPILYDVARSFHQDIVIIITSVYPIDEQQRLMPQAADYFDKSDSMHKLVRKVSRFFHDLDRKKRILVIDDNETTRDIYHNVLTLAGFDTVAVHSSDELMGHLKHLQRNITEIDLIIVNHQCLNFHGINVKECIQKHAPQTKMIVVVDHHDSLNIEFNGDEDCYFDASLGNLNLILKAKEVCCS